MSMQFRDELETLINRHSMENGSDTPDWVLANYLVDCLRAYDKSVIAREKWYGRPPAFSTGDAPTPANTPAFFGFGEDKNNPPKPDQV